MTLYHHYYNFKRVTGPTKDVYNADNIVGECTYIRGNAQNLTGDVSGICGDISGLCGDATNVTLYLSINYLYIGDVAAMRCEPTIAEVM